MYKIDPSGQETVLHSFTPTGFDGINPYAGVILDATGNLYGTTQNGGASGNGTVYKIDTTGHETIIFSFGGSTDGGLPDAGVLLDSAGNLYGTTLSGGASGNGTVYKIDATGHETVIHSFHLGTDGTGPIAGVVRDSAGNLYGTTVSGGASGNGTVYKIDATGHETVIHSFAAGTDGTNPYAGVVRDSAGNLYGTAYQGGALSIGTVYRIDVTGHETLYSFPAAPGGTNPSYGGLVGDSMGNLYGTTLYGGTSGLGTVYKIDATGHETVIHSFHLGTDGTNPYAGVVRDSAGNLYGTTAGGGPSFGTVYKIDPTGHETVLYSFADGTDGANPYAGVILDSAGNLYGTTIYGGPSFLGTVYKIDPSGHETVLHTFAGGTDGADPRAEVVLDSAGNLYGTTYLGGASGLGTVYKIDATGHETVIHSFAGGTDGTNPYAGVVRDSAGNLYGTTAGGGASGLGTV